MDIIASWRQSQAVIATMHGKERVIGPRLEAAFGISVLVPTTLNTDTFGTFTREVKRPHDQLETARQKALAGIKATGARIGIASEGSFGPHPTIPFVQANYEVVVLIDSETGFETVGTATATNVTPKGQWVTSAEEAVATATAWGFPVQGVIVRVSKEGRRGIYKEITSIDNLLDTTTRLLRPWWRRQIYLETDMRAHRCGARMETIAAATDNLIARITERCPACCWPGFSQHTFSGNLPCAHCGQATSLPTTRATRCRHCGHTETESLATTADPAECNYCNP